MSKGHRAILLSLQNTARVLRDS